MSEPSVPETHPAGLDHGERMSALFAYLVMQQTNMAMMLMGKTAHPETGKVVRDLEAAKLFIDQLEMLEEKTRGNLTKEEAALLKQGLMNLRLAFVEAVEAPAPPAAARPQPGAPTAGPGQTSGSGPTAPGNPPSTAPAEEHRTKFSKKY